MHSAKSEVYVLVTWLAVHSYKSNLQAFRLSMESYQLHFQCKNCSSLILVKVGSIFHSLFQLCQFLRMTYNSHLQRLLIFSMLFQPKPLETIQKNSGEDYVTCFQRVKKKKKYAIAKLVWDEIVVRVNLICFVSCFQL